jgi:hypothetical protein
MFLSNYDFKKPIDKKALGFSSIFKIRNLKYSLVVLIALTSFSLDRKSAKAQEIFYESGEQNIL